MKHSIRLSHLCSVKILYAYFNDDFPRGRRVKMVHNFMHISISFPVFCEDENMQLPIVTFHFSLTKPADRICVLKGREEERNLK